MDTLVEAGVSSKDIAVISPYNLQVLSPYISHNDYVKENNQVVRGTESEKEQLGRLLQHIRKTFYLLH